MAQKPELIPSDQIDAVFLEQLLKLQTACPHITGRDMEMFLWPKGVPLHAFKPKVACEWAGIKVIVPEPIYELSQKLFSD